MIGQDPYHFETAWSKSSDVSIYIYDDPPSVAALGLALDISKYSEIVTASKYDMSSRVRTAQEGEHIVLKNRHGYYAIIKVVDVKDRTRSDSIDELTFEYYIQTNQGQDFSK